MFNHLVGVNVGDSVGGVARTTIYLAQIAGPGPQDALNQIHAVEGESIGACLVYHGLPAGLPVIGVVFLVAGLICRIQRSPKSTHHIQSFIFRGDGAAGVYKGGRFHFSHCGSHLHSANPV